MTNIIEGIARAICESVGPEGSSDARSQMGDWPAWHDWVPQARAALLHLSQRFESEGKHWMAAEFRAAIEEASE